MIQLAPGSTVLERVLQIKRPCCTAWWLHSVVKVDAPRCFPFRWSQTH